MHHLDATPPFPQILGDEAAVALVGLVFAAEQAAVVEQRGVQGFLDAALAHEVEEALLVGGPIDLGLPVGGEQHLRGREGRNVGVVHAADLPQEPRQVVPFGEARQLRRVVEAHVHHALHAGAAQQVEEALGGLLGEADGEQAHGPHPASAAEGA